jgi:hypothetical protein
MIGIVVLPEITRGVLHRHCGPELGRVWWGSIRVMNGSSRWFHAPPGRSRSSAAWTAHRERLFCCSWVVERCLDRSEGGGCSPTGNVADWLRWTRTLASLDGAFYFIFPGVDLWPIDCDSFPSQRFELKGWIPLGLRTTCSLSILLQCPGAVLWLIKFPSLWPPLGSTLHTTPTQGHVLHVIVTISLLWWHATSNIDIHLEDMWFADANNMGMMQQQTTSIQAPP